MEQGHLEVICGCMFSGKTEELIRRLKRATSAKQRVQVFKHAFDDRYDELAIASHSGLKLPTVTAGRTDELVRAVEPGTAVIGIDEIQFFPEDIVFAVEEVLKRGVRVIAAGLDLDFRGEPFGPMPQLMAIAERVDKLHAICVVCGDLATRNQRLIDGSPAPAEGPTIQVGGAETYEARCRKCHQVPQTTRHQTELEIEPRH